MAQSDIHGHVLLLVLSCPTSGLLFVFMWSSDLVDGVRHFLDDMTAS